MKKGVAQSGHDQPGPSKMRGNEQCESYKQTAEGGRAGQIAPVQRCADQGLQAKGDDVVEQKSRRDLDKIPEMGTEGAVEQVKAGQIHRQMSAGDNA